MTTVSDLMHLIKQYGHFCTESAIADERDKIKRFKAMDEAARSQLERIKTALLDAGVIPGNVKNQS